MLTSTFSHVILNMSVALYTFKVLSWHIIQIFVLFFIEKKELSNQ